MLDRRELISEQTIINHLSLALEELIFFSDEAALFFDKASLFLNEALLFFDQSFLCGKQIGLDGTNGVRFRGVIIVAVGAAVAVDMAIAVVVDPGRFVVDIVAAIRIVSCIVAVVYRRRGRTLQDHLSVKLVIVEHPAAFGIGIVAVSVIIV